MSRHYIFTRQTHMAVPATLFDWALWFEDETNRRVAEDTLPDGSRVSTVALGTDHQFGVGPPLLLETMVFGGPSDNFCRRYTTWDEAVVGHEEIVAALAEGRTLE